MMIFSIRPTLYKRSGDFIKDEVPEGAKREVGFPVVFQSAFALLKRIGERYLGGKVFFISDEKEGITFGVRLKMRLP